MPTGFARTLTLLRKERGISQKQAAAALDISQALLSHYEKGIRECRLEFVVRVADYYNVSCDYLLGRTPDKSGAMLTVDDLPEGELTKDGRTTESMLPVLNKKLALNAISVLFDVLKRCKHKELTAEVSTYLNLAIYTVFRSLYAANAKNPSAITQMPKIRVINTAFLILRFLIIPSVGIGTAIIIMPSRAQLTAVIIAPGPFINENKNSPTGIAITQIVLMM